ncbi:hypothetical protein ACOME3_008700 [Neoechinorhynchus agilis]
MLLTLFIIFIVINNLNVILAASNQVKTLSMKHMNFKFPPLVQFDGKAVQISEGRKNGSFLALVEIISHHKPLKWHLTSSDPAFRLNHKHGLMWTLNLNSDMDREQIPFYNFSIDAVEIPQEHSTQLPNRLRERLFVRIMDVNDNAPTFDKSLYTTSVTLIDTNNDLSNNDVLIARLEASDKDEGENARIEYLLDNYDDIFRVDRRSGHVFYRPSLIPNLVKGESRRFDVVIRARDHGHPILSTTTIMRISVHSMSSSRNSSSLATIGDHRARQRLTVLTICAIGACLLVILIVIAVAGSGFLCALWIKRKLKKSHSIDGSVDDSDTLSNENTTFRTQIITPPISNGCCMKKFSKRGNYELQKSSCSSTTTAKNGVGSNSTATSACSTGYLSSVVAFNTSPTENLNSTHHDVERETNTQKASPNKEIYLTSQKKSPYIPNTKRQTPTETTFPRQYKGKCYQLQKQRKDQIKMTSRNKLDNMHSGLFVKTDTLISPTDNGYFCNDISHVSSPVDSCATSTSINVLVRSAMIPSFPIISTLGRNERASPTILHQSKEQPKGCSASFV